MHTGQVADPGSEISFVQGAVSSSTLPAVPQVPLLWVGTEVELGSIWGQLPGVLQGQQAPVLCACFPLVYL